MPQKVIFLDVDGVMNHHDTITDAERGFVSWLDPKNVAVLNEVVRATGAVVVISSGWRWSMPFGELRAAFAEAGCVAEVIDVTPDIDGHRRGREILAWIAAQAEAPACYLALDDEHEMPELGGRALKIDPSEGLSLTVLPRVLALLEG
ncbi:MAG: HAD domain-containing protein [Nannocystaceae bacterium]